MKRVLIICTMILLSPMLFAKILPSNYYDLKKSLEVTEGGLIVTEKRKEADLNIVLNLLEILKEYEAINNEIMEERRFVESCLYNILPLGEYQSDSHSAICDNYEKCPTAKRNIYLTIKNWKTEELKQYYMRTSNITEEISREMADAFWTIKNVKTRNSGKAKYRRIFDKNVLVPGFINGYFEMLVKDGKLNEIRNFHGRYFDGVRGENLQLEDTALFLSYLMSSYKDGRKDAQIVSEFIDKIERTPMKKIIINSAPERKSDALVEVICVEKSIKNNKVKVIKFLNDNPGLFENRSEPFTFNNETRRFLLENKNQLKLKEEILIQIENIKQ